MGAGIIPTMPSRRQIEESVEALREEHEGGRAFAEAVERYAGSLDDDEREVLGEVLLQRADEEGAFQRGIALRATVTTSTSSSGNCCAQAASTSHGPAQSSSSAPSKR